MNIFNILEVTNLIEKNVYYYYIYLNSFYGLIDTTLIEREIVHVL